MGVSIFQLKECVSGNVLTVAAIAAPVMLGFAGLAIDVGNAFNARAELRGAAEAAALSLAESFTASERFTPLDTFTHESEFKSNLDVAIDVGRSNLPPTSGQNAIVSADFEPFEWNPIDEIQTPFVAGEEVFLNSVKVVAEYSEDRGNQVPTFFSKLFDFKPKLSHTVHAAAAIVPTFHILNESEDGSFTIDSNADIDIATLWINSSSENAYLGPIGPGFGSNGVLAGEASTSASRIWQNKFPLPDLLAEQDIPSYSFSCDHTDLVIEDPGFTLLNPGVYCGGLTIRNSGEVQLNPGLYQFVGEPLSIVNVGEVNGFNVLLQFFGPDAVLETSGADLNLGGITDGAFRGLVIVGDRSDQNRTHLITNRSHLKISGTVYLPADHIFINSSQMDGNCNSLCLVSDTMTFTGSSHINWYPSFTGNLPSWLLASPREAPEALEPFLRPFLYYPD